MQNKLFFALMYADKNIYKRIKQILINKFGHIKQESFEYRFGFTNYYEKEFGKNLLKRFIVFNKSISNNELPNIKLQSAEIEKQFTINNLRTINIDPGYITTESLVLASFKNSPYKEPIGNNVYSHLTLKFEGNKAIETERTFPDYKKEEVKEFFLNNKN